MKRAIIGGIIALLLVGALGVGGLKLKAWRKKQRAAQAEEANLREIEAAKRATCRNFLRLIDTAKGQWAFQKAVTNVAEPSWSDLSGYLGGSTLTCPSGGKYQLNTPGTKPVCSVHNQAE